MSGLTRHATRKRARVAPEDSNAELYVALAMEEAELAYAAGNDPFGAVLVSPDGAIVIREHNRVAESTDPSAHAEMNAIRVACQRLGARMLSGYTMYTNARSCPMCLWAMISVGISRLYYGAPSVVPAKLGDSLLDAAREHGAAFGVVSGIRERDATAQLERLSGVEALGFVAADEDVSSG